MDGDFLDSGGADGIGVLGVDMRHHLTSGDNNSRLRFAGQSISGFGGFGFGFVEGLNGVDGRRCVQWCLLDAFFGAAFFGAAFFLVAIHLSFFTGFGCLRAGGNGSDGLMVFGGSASVPR